MKFSVNEYKKWLDMTEIKIKVKNCYFYTSKMNSN